MRDRLRWHVLVLGLLLLVVWPLLDLDGPFISDEGSYAVQARALERGSWDMGHPIAAVDPDAEFAAFYGSRVVDGQVVPYVDHPLWPRTLWTASSVLGEEIGFRVVGVASLLGLAAVAWALAQELGSARAGPWAFWLAATSSILADAWMLWAHAPSALAGALLMLAAVRSRRAPGWLVVTGLAAALSVLLRAEGVLWVGAVAVAVVLSGRDVAAVRRGLVIGGSGAVAYGLERWWISGILGSPGAGELAARGDAAGALDRVTGFRTVLIDGAFASQGGRALGLGIVLATVAATVAIRRGRDDRLVVAALVVAALLVIARLVVATRDPAAGLLVVAPSLVLAAVWRRPAGTSRSAAPLALGIFAAALLVSIYPDGGSWQWGGRFLSPAVGVLAALAAGAIADHLGTRAGSPRHRLAGALVVLLAAQAAASLIAPNEIRKASEEPIDQVVAAGPSLLIADGTQIARLDWRGWPERCWVAVPEDREEGDLARLLGLLADSGVRDAVYVGFAPDEVEAAGGVLREPVGDLEAGVLTLPGAAGDRRISPPYGCDR